MITIKRDKKIYYYEGLWNDGKKKIKDSKNKALTFPVANNIKWQQQDSFVKKLLFLQKTAKSRKSNMINRNCLLCDKKNISDGVYNVNDIYWDHGLVHYIKAHRVKPSQPFIDFIFSYFTMSSTSRETTHFNCKKIEKNNLVYVKLKRNQILIMDALLEHGGKKIYFDKNTNEFKYSEHIGFLDIDKKKNLKRIVILATTDSIDPRDDEIFLPSEDEKIKEYEFIFHTHPATPYIGGRAACSGKLYEFPSIEDICHFISHKNLQGSIVITPEGLYNIRKHDLTKPVELSKIFFEDLKLKHKIEDKATAKYCAQGYSYEKMTKNDYFYSVIAQDKKYINEINKILIKHNMFIDYFPRQKDGDTWIINDVYLPILPCVSK